MDSKVHREIWKTKGEGKHFSLGNPGVSQNHATAQWYYSYESWLRIWNPDLFLILTRDPSLLPNDDTRTWLALGFYWRAPVAAGSQSAVWPRPAVVTAGPGLGRLQLAVAKAWAREACHGGVRCACSQRYERKLQAREIEWGSGGGCGGRSGARLCVQRGAGDRSRGGGRVVSMHGRHALTTCPTVEAFHRTRVGQRCGQRGKRFGPDLDRIWTWTKNEVCSTLDTPQLWIRCHGH